MLVDVSLNLSRRPPTVVTTVGTVHCARLQTGAKVARRGTSFITADRTGPRGPTYVNRVCERSQVPAGGVGGFFAFAATTASAASTTTTIGIERLTAQKV